MFVALFIVGCGNSTHKPPQISSLDVTNATQPADKEVGLAGPGSGGDGGGDPLDGGDWLESAEDAGPLNPQSLCDFEAESIGPWGPVLWQQTVPDPGGGGGTTTVNRLSSSDPFTATYQLEDGSILVTNEDLSQGIPVPESEYDPPIVQWTGPDDQAYNIVGGEIITYFVDAATQNNIEQFITDHNLHVIMSWFEPPAEGLEGNALAWFHFEYDRNEFPTFDDAFNFFAAHELIESVWPAFSDGLHRWYTGNTNPNDEYYQDDETRHINIFGVDQSQRVPLGPSTPGNWFSNQVVAVIDDGVDRWHEDFHIHGFPWFYRKISWVGANVYRKTYWVRYWAGEPNWYDPVRQGLASHGTRVSGFITASTNNAGIDVASLAPRTLVLPLRMRQNFEGLFYPDCEVKAVRALRFKFAHGAMAGTGASG